MSTDPMPQPNLFGEIPQPTLTERQQLVLNEIRRHPDGITADEAGAHLHHARGKHAESVRCEWCTTDGRSVLRALTKKKLARKTLDGHYRHVRHAEPPDSPDSGQTHDILY